MKIQHLLYFVVTVTIIVLACQKESDPVPEENKPKDIEGKLAIMRNNYWEEYRPDSSNFPPIMKFRFFGDSSVDYIYLSHWFSPYKYDSNVNAVWRLIPPDTIRFFGSAGGNFSFGQYKLLDISDSVMTVNIPNYADSVDFVPVF